MNLESAPNIWFYKPLGARSCISYCSNSRQLMLLSLLFLQASCTLRVSSEPPAYEGETAIAWKTLFISGVMVFGLNIALTMMHGQPAFIEL